MRKFLLGAGALLTIIVILIGVPVALILAAGNPVPTATQFHDIVTLIPDYGNVILLTKVLPCLAWVAWVLFAGPLLVEIGASIAGRQTTKRVWVLKGQQYAAAALVSAVLIMFASFAGFHTVASPVGQAAPAPSISIGPVRTMPAPSRVPEHPVVAAADAIPQPRNVIHTVLPGDNLWDISEQYYGVGTRDMDIFRASTGTLQPGGQRLTNPNLIRPGWQLTVPGVPVAAAPTSSAVPEPVPDGHAAKKPANSPPVSAANPQAVASTGNPESSATPTTPSTSSPSTSSRSVREDGVRTVSDFAVPLSTAGGVVGLLAAAILFALGRRRLNQRRRRRSGQRIAMPEGAVAEFEQELRMLAKPLELADIDDALRLLQVFAEDTGTALPELLAIRMAEEEITFYLTHPAELPEPFRAGTAERTVWTIQAGSRVTPPRTVLSPYPALIIIGVDDNAGVLLLDLERLGILNVTGDHDSAEGILNAMAAELAGNPWGEQIQVTTVGLSGRLSRTINRFRIQQSGDIAVVLPGVKAELEEREAALKTYGVDDVHSGRVLASETESWAPHILLLATMPDEPFRQALITATAKGARLGFAVIAAGELNLGSATIRIGAPGRAELILTGGVMPPLPFTPQTLGPGELGLLQELFDTTDNEAAPAVAASRETNDASPEPSVIAARPESDSSEEPGTHSPDDVTELPAQGEAAISPTTLPAREVPAPRAPYIRLLGPVEAEGLDPATEMPGRGIELMAYLLLREGPVDGLQLQRAFWPDTRDASNNQRGLAKQVRVALGRSSSGEPFLPENANHHGYALHPDIRSDWDDFRALIGEDPTLASSERLIAALHLVRGTPFAGSNTRRWWQWIAIAQEVMIAAIMDAANELGDRALTSHNAPLVRFAARIQQAVDPLNEAGWRIELKAALQVGDIDTFHAVLEDLYARVGGDDPDYDVDDDTRALIDRANQRIRA
ncbi:LysM peptidoglycan-binding domain-containing protein [Lacisediminihabitans sp. H27-G8]|uniref:LysM peptidoglycan-binding domain-containing protein n=1 Tax=Lacisediminihabitans sp. H27-G8 TaxID=3111909 RepID=UPI0038FCA97F